MGASTEESLTLWFDLVHEISYKWTELMEEAWKDLPPDTSRKLLKASRAFADAGENLMKHLGVGQED